MNVISKFVYELLIDPLGLPVNILIEYFILGIIEVIAHKVVFSSVGDLYNSGRISTRIAGILIYWPLRLLFVVFVWTVTYGVIWGGKIVITHWAVALVCLGVAVFLGSMIALMVHHKHKGGVKNA